MCGEQNPADGQAIDEELRYAEAALQASQSANYYEILNISRNATETNIAISI
ncbi:hypothetical protein FRB93_012027 [Tulasnella sp. JGI-2019a]|nr:hypothetical protein FRB93_012027 [Tulasnella sp. JGI-2019a]